MFLTHYVALSYHMSTSIRNFVNCKIRLWSSLMIKYTYNIFYIWNDWISLRVDIASALEFIYILQGDYPPIKTSGRTVSVLKRRLIWLWFHRELIIPQNNWISYFWFQWNRFISHKLHTPENVRKGLSFPYVFVGYEVWSSNNNIVKHQQKQ